jgi:hypothetical protein
MSSRRLTFHQLCQPEPRLRQFFLKVRAISDDKSRRYCCANELWNGCAAGNHTPGNLREELDDLVGFFAGNPKLRTGEAHDLAHQVLYNLPPDRRDCSCLAIREVIRHRRRLAGRRDGPVGSNHRTQEAASAARK